MLAQQNRPSTQIRFLGPSVGHSAEVSDGPNMNNNRGGKARKGGRKSKKAKLGSNPDSPDSDDHIVPEDLNYRLATPGR